MEFSMPNKSVTWRSFALSQHLAACTAGAVLALRIVELSKTYHVLAFFAKRVRTKDGRPVESIAPVDEGRTIFGNSFDLSHQNAVEIFRAIRSKALKNEHSYIQYILGTVRYFIIEAEHVEWIVNNKDLIGKGGIYKLLEPAIGLGLVTSSGQKWYSNRKMLTPTFHFDILDQFTEVIKAESIQFLEQFEGTVEASISLTKLIPRFTLNTICECAMGIRLDDMAEEGDRYRESISLIEQSVVKRFGNPLYWNDAIYNFCGAREDKKFLKVIHEFSSEIIAKRRKILEVEIKDEATAQLVEEEEEHIYIKKKQRFAMLDTLIFAEKDGLIDHEGICEQVDTLMYAGFDTTSIGLKFTLMNMGLYQDQQELCYQEICEYIPDDVGSLESSHLSNLKYLDCFIKETLRLYPPILTIGRVTPKEMEFVNGLILPAGSEFIMDIYSLHRNPKYWTEPEKFDPDRFLPENSRTRHTYAYVPFSAGPRNCIGQKYAMLEMKTFLSIVLKHFRILPLVHPEDLLLQTGITLGCSTDVRVKLVRRH